MLRRTPFAAYVWTCSVRVDPTIYFEHIERASFMRRNCPMTRVKLDRVFGRWREKCDKGVPSREWESSTTCQGPSAPTNNAGKQQPTIRHAVGTTSNSKAPLLSKPVSHTAPRDLTPKPTPAPNFQHSGLPIPPPPCHHLSPTTLPRAKKT
jgi:hypothetical protein